MAKPMSPDELWSSAPSVASEPWGGPSPDLPASARRYLSHAIAVGTPLAGRARLQMHGEIKLGPWSRFRAEQVIQVERGMIWAGSVRLFGLPVRGFDRILDGQGAMRWKLFGFIPIVNEASPDVSRSAAGRLAAELTWLPSRLARSDVDWSGSDDSVARARLELWGESTELCLGCDPSGKLQSLQLERWGNPPESPKFDYFAFGGVIEEEASFGGFTVPTRLRIGWHAGTDRFEKEGEFIRVTVDGAEYL
jgi:hypothetical protein